MGNGPGYMWFISENSEHKEEALRLFNYMCDPDFVRELTLGRRGETWDYDEDGVPEAIDKNDEMFGARRMVAALNTNADGRPDEILRNVRSAVDEFVGDAEQFDDITMLCVEYLGSKSASL